MKIDLKTEQSKREIVKLRSLIINSTQLKTFDEFVAKNSTLDFSDDQHIAALRSPKQDCHCFFETDMTIHY